MMVLGITALVGATLLALVYFPSVATQLYGKADPSMGFLDRIVSSIRLVVEQKELLAPMPGLTVEREFVVDQGESVSMITLRLEQEGIIPNAELLRLYLIYTGTDKTIQSGTFTLTPGQTPVDIALSLQDATPMTVSFGILPGWRAEEIAGSLATSGLTVTGEEFMAVVNDPSALVLPEKLGSLDSLEGFIFPAVYEIPRQVTLPEMLDQILVNFSAMITPDLLRGFSDQGLTLYQAVTLASMVQREAVHEDEMPMIASVFHNRLEIGMKLDSDPTLQYALGYYGENQSWWKNPLSNADTQIESLYNTYMYAGLPPTPICNPGLAALTAVAFPAESDFFYFRAKCDGTGYHNFAITLDEQLANECP